MSAQQCFKINGNSLYICFVRRIDEMALISHIRICDTISYTCIKSEFVSRTHFIHLYIASHNASSGNDQWILRFIIFVMDY